MADPEELKRTVDEEIDRALDEKLRKKLDEKTEKIKEGGGKAEEKKPEEEDFKKMYILREALIILVGRIILAELIFSALFFILSIYAVPAAFINITAYNLQIFSMLELVNIPVIIYILISWYNRKYVISPQEVSLMKGFILKSQDIYPIQSMISVNISQNPIGLFLNYGTIRLESPLLKKTVYIKNVRNPKKHSEIIEKQRLKSLDKLAE